MRIFENWIGVELGRHMLGLGRIRRGVWAGFGEGRCHLRVMGSVFGAQERGLARLIGVCNEDRIDKFFFPD